VKNESKEDIDEDGRVARKPGQPANSKKHSDLYTDENPKGTITGLKFATVEDAKASVSKIRNSGRSHAHKVQAAVAMEQRARAAGKSSAAAVYRSYINSVKKTNESLEYYVTEGICPECQGIMVAESQVNEKQDACYHKVKSRYKVWPSAYASGALVQCRKKGAANWGNKSKSVEENFADGEIKESKETRQALLDQHFEFPQQGQYGYRTGYQGRGVLEVADGRTGKIINLGEFGTFDGDREPNQKWLRIVFTNPNMDDNAWDELEDMLWSDDQVAENFADGKNPQDKGDSARHGIPKGATMAQLEKAAKASGRKGQLARWQINMRRGKKK
jgi:hypothetical protein